MPKIKVNNPKNIIKGTPTRYYFKLHNTGGPKGDKGDTGDTGPQGPKGDTGNAATVQVGSTTTLPVGQDATVENVGNQYAAILNFGIPQGPQGPQGVKGDKGDTGDTGPQGATGAKGDPGTNATVYVGTTTTGNPGTQASVRNSGTENNAVLNFTIPQGATGAVGPANTLSIGSVTRGADASATITGDAPNQTLNLVLPKGDKGDTGATGAEGPRGPQGIQGETGEAFSIYKTYSSVADMNADASNVPEGKFTLIASNVDDPDNSKLFVKNGEGTFTYLTDMSGAQGIQGPAGPQGVRGDTGPVGPQGETGPRGSVKSQYVAELPASGDEDTFYITDKDLESHTESGEYITLETTQTAAAIQSAELNGNATQTTYSGKNLIQPSSMYAVSYNVTVESGDSSVNITSGTGYATYTIPTQFEPTDKVTFSCKGVQKSGTGLRVAYRHSDDGTTWTQYVTVAEVKNTTVNQQYSLVGTTTGYAYYQIVFFARGYSSTTETNNAVYSEVQFEKGDTATSYEPFVGGTPAPNPSYPQPISVVTGENVVKVVGKNLFDSTIEQGTLNSADGLPSSSPSRVRTARYISGKASATYTINAMTNSEQAQAIAFFYKADNTFLGRSATSFVTTPHTFTTPAETAKLKFAFTNRTSTDITPSELVDIQLEFGNQATAYEAFAEQEFKVNLGGNALDIGTSFDDYFALDASGTRVKATSITSKATGTIQDGKITVSTYDNSDGYWWASKEVTLEKNTNYTFSTADGTHARLNIIGIADFEIGTVGTVLLDYRPTDTAPATFNTGNYNHYVFTFYPATGSANNNGVIDRPMLQKGTTATGYCPYAPYQLELAKIGTYQDRIYKEGEKWYIEKKVGKVVPESSDVGIRDTYTNIDYAILPKPLDSFMSGNNDSPLGKIISSCAIPTDVPGGFDNARYVGKLSSQPSQTNYWIGFVKGTTLASMQSALDGQIIYYVLATPTTTEITDQTLIDQLEALASATLGYGVNNIWTEIATGNAMPTLELNWVEWEKYNRHNVYIWNDDIDDWQVIAQ